MKNKLKIAVVGATGLVGRTMLRILEEREFPVVDLILLSSPKGAGSVIAFRGVDYTVDAISEDSFESVDIALFSAGKDVSVKYALIAAAKGCVVIDNGSYWRMHKKVPLIVPEVNPDALIGHHGIIANPNCSTIQLVVALKPIHRTFGIKRMIVSTYQSISGAGQKGINQLNDEILGKEPAERVSKLPIAYNTVFHSITDSDGNSEEEIKMTNEPRKIFNDFDLKISVTCVRLPILGGHGESVNIETEKPTTVEELSELLNNSAGVTVIDDPVNSIYPTPLMSKDKDDVFVGRIRKDNSIENGFNLWIVADNIRKGAATNAVQIAELVLEKNLFEFERADFNN